MISFYSSCCIIAANLLAEGYGIRTVQGRLDRPDVRAVMVCKHVLNPGGKVDLPGLLAGPRD